MHVIKEVSSLNLFQKLVIIPNFQSPHKDRPFFYSKDRLEKIKDLIPTFPKTLTYEICEWEMQQKKTCYTIDTICHLLMVYPQTTFYLVLGSDSFFSLHLWKDYQNVCRLVHLVVVRRDTKSAKTYEDYHVTFFPDTPLTITGHTVVDMSSTQLKNRQEKNV